MSSNLQHHLAGMSPEQKRARLAQLLRRKILDAGVHPLAPSEEQMWLLQAVSPESRAYNSQMAAYIDGPLDVGALERSLTEIARRHEVLRTTYPAPAGAPIRKVSEPSPVALPVVDLRASEDPEAEVIARIREEIDKTYDLIHGPLFFAVLYRLGDERHVLLLRKHHVIVDAWSFGVFMRELEALYPAFAAGAPSPLPELPLQYLEYASWQQERMATDILPGHLAYWKDKLAGAPRSIALPTDFPRPPSMTFPGARPSIKLPEELVAAVTEIGKRFGATTFVVMLTALKILLYRWTSQSDLIVGTVSANRNRSGLEGLIGCFVNFLPLRTELHPDDTVTQAIERVMTTVLESYAHQECPFKSIVTACRGEHRPDRNPLFNVSFLLQNLTFMECTYLPSEFDIGLKAASQPSAKAQRLGRDLEARWTIMEPNASLLDLRFLAVPEPGNPRGLSVGCEHNSNLFSRATAERLLEGYQGVLEQLVRGLDARLDTFALPSPLTAGQASATIRDREQRLLVSATFTADPVEEPLAFWMRELDIPARVEIAPYHQVFQLLIDPASPIHKNEHGVNILLIRLEDWKGGAIAEPDEAPAAIERNARELIDLLKETAPRAAAPFIVCLCPASPEELGRPGREDLMRSMETLFERELAGVRGVDLVTSESLLRTYPVVRYDDARANELGHVPYTTSFFIALGTMIARRVHARRSAGFKVIAVDGDGSLWGGVAAEDGPENVAITPAHRALQSFLVEQQKQGALLCLVSRNLEADIDAVFEAHPDMPLQPEHIAARRIGWRRKSESLKELSAELRLSLDDFVFIDDDPVECAEVRERLPEVLVLELPASGELHGSLDRLWIFDRPSATSATAEDTRRTELYLQDRERERFRGKAPSLAEFIEGLGLRVRISEVDPKDFARVAQLTQRTSQWNASLRVRTEQEIERMVAGRFTCLTVKVSDRFGDYGLVGAMIFDASDVALTIDTFVLSCRALGRGIELRMLEKLAGIASEWELRSIDIPFIEGPRNQPLGDFLSAVAGNHREARPDGGFVFRLPVEEALSISTPIRANVSPPGPPSLARAEGGPPSKRDGRATLPEPPQASRSRSEQIARIAELADVTRILAAVKRFAQRRTETEARSSTAPRNDAPRNDTEEHLAELFRGALRTENLGIDDSFFEHGGDSLGAVQVLANAGSAFGIDLPLQVLVETPTIRGLAALIDRLLGKARPGSPRTSGPASFPPAPDSRRSDRAGPVSSRVGPISSRGPDSLPTSQRGAAISKRLPRPNLAVELIPPRTPTEEKLAAIWAEVLGLERVGMRDTFLELGGNSLLGAQVLARIREAFGWEPPLSLLQGQLAGTLDLERLAEAMDEGMAKQAASGSSQQPAWSPLVRIRPDGSFTPFFCVHPIAGSAFCYIDLARCLRPEQPFFGLQAPGLDGNHEPIRSLEGMAGHYIEAIRSVQPTGPYKLGGWSMGGLVALEMAQQLVRRGASVASLVLMDTRFDGTFGGRSIESHDDPALLALFATDLSRGSGREVKVDEDYLRTLVPEAQIDYILERLTSAGILPPNAKAAQIRSWIRVFRANVEAFSTYTPSPYPGSLTALIAGDERGSTRDPFVNERGAITAVSMARQRVPGDHYTLLRDPNVQTLAETLTACLDGSAGK
jgi:FkbH-like protein